MAKRHEMPPSLGLVVIGLGIILILFGIQSTLQYQRFQQEGAVVNATFVQHDTLPEFVKSSSGRKRQTSDYIVRYEWKGKPYESRLGGLSKQQFDPRPKPGDHIKGVIFPNQPSVIYALEFANNFVRIIFIWVSAALAVIGGIVLMRYSRKRAN